jgi:NADH-quinone oxidoreductase subunit E
VPISDATREEAQRLIKRYPVARSALLPLLHLVQADEGYVSEDGIALCAELLGLTKAEVGAVSTFYTMYKREPFGDYLLSVCTNPTCKIAGGDEIYSAYVDACGGEIDREGGVMVEHAECLGICDAAPVVQINYEMFGPVTTDEAMGLLDQAKAGDPPASNWSGEKPATFRQVQRELAGLEDGVDEYLIEAAALQAQAAVPPAYRSGETDIPVTHPGGDPAGHGGEAFRESAGLALAPVEERGPGPKGELGPDEQAEAAEIAEEVGGEAQELAETAAGQQPAEPTPAAEDQPAVDEVEGGTSPEADTRPATGSEDLEDDDADPAQTRGPDDAAADGDETRGEEA